MALLLATAFVVVSGVLGIATTEDASDAHPGHPGTADAPTTLWSEDFENISGDWVGLTSYASASGVSYGGSAFWTWLAGCNGFVARRPAVYPPTPASPCAHYDNDPAAIGHIATSIAAANGGGADTTNHALAWYSYEGDVDHPLTPGQSILGTSQISSVGQGRFVRLQYDMAVTNCGYGEMPLLTGHIVDNGVPHEVVPTVANPCVDLPFLAAGQFGDVHGATVSSGAYLTQSANVGVRITNEQANAFSNDGGLDNFVLQDVTPQLDVDFGADAQTGQNSTITYTITNTSDDLPKTGWTFTGTLPAGLTVAGAVTNTCGTPEAVLAPIGGSSISTPNGGGINPGIGSCSISVPVTSASAATYNIGAADVTSVGLKAPGTSSVTFTAPPAPGSLAVTKSVTGTAPSGTTFTVGINCNDGTAHDATLTFSSTGSLQSGTSPITGIPAGTQCTVTETSTGGADSVAYTVGAGSPSGTAPTVSITSGTTTAVAVTNTFNPAPGALAVTKSVTGTAPSGTTFTVGVNCNDGTAHDATLTFSSTGSLLSGTSPITGIPAGTQCTVTETNSGGADSVAYSVAGGAPTSTAPTVTIVSGATTPVTVTNTFTPPPPPPPPGGLDVGVVISGPHLGQGYTVSVNCDGTAYDRTFGFSPSGDLTSGSSPITGIPAGTGCSVAETNSGGASSIAYSINGGGAVGSASVTIASGATTSVVVINRFSLPIVDPIVDPVVEPAEDTTGPDEIVAPEPDPAPVPEPDPAPEPLPEEIDENRDGLIDISTLLGDEDDEFGVTDADGDGVPDEIAAGEDGGHGTSGDFGNAFSGENASKSIFSGEAPSIWEVVKNPELMAAAVGMGMVWTLALVTATSALESAIGARIDDWSAFAGKAFPGAKTLGGFFSFLVSESWLAVGALMTVNAMILSFVDPNFGFDWLSLRALASVLLATVLVVVVPLLIVRRYGQRLWGTNVTFRTSPWGLVIGMLGVVVSRMIGFLPGLLGGSPMEVELEDDDEADKARVTATKIALTLGLAALLLAGASLVPDSGSWQMLFLHDAMTAGAIVAIFGPFIDLLPVSIFAGSELWKHTRKVWFLLMAIASAAFAVVVLPDPSYWLFVGDDAKRWIMISTGVMVTALLAVIVVTKLETAEKRDEARAKLKKALAGK